MAASQAISAQGTTITLDGNPVDEITGFSGVGVDVDIVEVTNIDSDDNFEEHIKVLKRGGEITLDMNYTKTTYTALDILVKDFTDPVVDFVLTTTDGARLTVPVLVIMNKISGSAADKISASVTLKVTGDVVLTNVP